jgi:hypothetical protein
MRQALRLLSHFVGQLQRKSNNFARYLPPAPVETYLLYAAARLNLADTIANGAKSIEELTALIDVNADILVRLLRGWVIIGVLTEEPGGHYSLTRSGQNLKNGSPIRGEVLVQTELFMAWAELLYAARTGESPFARRFGSDPFRHFAQDADANRTFNRSFANRDFLNVAIANAYPFPPDAHIVDVGGGYGDLLLTLLERNSGAKGTLLTGQTKKRPKS